MKFAIITHVKHSIEDGYYYGYGPYVREMNVWGKFVDELIIVAPIKEESPSSIDISYNRKVSFLKIPFISFINFSAAVKAILSIPFICFRIFKAVRASDHIHLRCPGNIGLLGSVVQIFFPKKLKTAKYAGNWDPNSKQPLSYRLQKWILSNTFLTKNMQVLVYGEWPNQSQNIRPFFTATYSKYKINGIQHKSFEPSYKFVFVGSLSPGKRPLYAIKLVEELNKLGQKAELAIYGEGSERSKIEEYIKEHQLENKIILYGNKTSEEVETAYQNSHFLILPSKSEGWPKAVAEAMFWGVIPIGTKISCVPWMLANGERGILIEKKLKKDTTRIASILEDKNQLKEMSSSAQKWSHQYTLDYFESEIKKVLS